MRLDNLIEELQDSVDRGVWILPLLFKLDVHFEACDRTRKENKVPRRHVAELGESETERL
jgi:hypothetical protein